MSKKYRLILVPETHWDREWYQPFQVFRMRLVKLFDHLLEILNTKPDYKSFTFDGQTIVLEDYLAIRPENRNRVKQLIEEGRILVGPWYILPDEFLVSGEATIRNLILGHRIASDYGRVMKVGLIPDSFGHIAQLPQILSGFGVDSTVFSRGLGDNWEGLATEFNWESPDGTSILAIYQMNSYGNCRNLGYTWIRHGRRGPVHEGPDYNVAVESVKSQIASLGPKASTEYLLLNSGCDHGEPQDDLPEALQFVNEHLEDAEVIHAGYEDLVAAVRAQNLELGTLRGELHQGKYYLLLPGVFSTRMYLKQANQQTQTLLEAWAEPMSTLSWLLGSRYEHTLLWEAWKLCIQNHPHDSICGCSIDQVHKEMMVRFDQSQQISDRLVTNSLDYITDRIDTRCGDSPDRQPVIVFNALGDKLDGTATYRTELPLPHAERPKFPIVRDAAGDIIPSQSSNRIIRDGTGTVVKGPRISEFDVCFPVEDLAGLGYKLYSVEYVNRKPVYDSPLKVSHSSAENDLIRLEINPNGSLTLTDKRTGHIYSGCNMFEDAEDAGDEYNYSPAYNTSVLTTLGSNARIALEANGPVFARFRIDIDLQLPQSLSSDRMSRSEELVSCPLTSLVTVYTNSPRVDISTTFDNRAKDHRLRALFRTGINTAVNHAESQFMVLERNNVPPKGENWVEKPVGTNAQQSFVDISDEKAGLTIINSGLPEYEVVQGSDGCTVALTLLRCVGWLSRSDFISRENPAGFKFETPDAQCLGTWQFNYALLPHAGDWKEAQVWKEAHAHNTPFRIVEVDPHPGELPNQGSFFTITGDGLVLSALKKAEGSDSLIVRLYNTTPETVTGSISCFKNIRLAVETNLNEEPNGKVMEIIEGAVKLTVPAYRIVSLQLEF